MFAIDSIRNRAAKLAIVSVTVMLLALMVTVFTRPAHAYQNVPGTDSFAAAQGLLVSPQDPGGGIAASNYYMTGTNSGATMEAGEPRPYSSIKDCGIYGVSNSVWWKVTVPGTYTKYLKFSTGGSSFDTVLAVYQGSSLTSLQQVACSNDNSLPNWNDRMYAALPGGRTYYVQLTGTGGLRSGNYSLLAKTISSTEYVRATKL